jgi:hypothetical protein
MASRHLAAVARSAEDYLSVYSTCLTRRLDRSSCTSWARCSTPQLGRYRGSVDIPTATRTLLDLIGEHRAKVDGVRVSSADSRPACPRRVAAASCSTPGRSPATPPVPWWWWRTGPQIMPSCSDGSAPILQQDRPGGSIGVEGSRQLAAPGRRAEHRLARLVHQHGPDQIRDVAAVAQSRATSPPLVGTSTPWIASTEPAIMP